MTLVSDVSHSSLALNIDGSFIYTSTAGYTGTDRFTYKASDGKADSGIATVTITVTASGNTPSTDTFALNSGDKNWNEAQNTLDVMRFQNNAGTGILTKLELLIDDTTPAGKVRLGVYADNNGKPSNLLLDAGEVAVKNGWVSINGSNLPVTQNTFYWLGFNLQKTNIVRCQSGQPARSHYWLSTAYGALPAQFNLARAGGSNNSEFVMRATVIKQQ
ncbi:MAG: hypothetical protein A2144_14915 [Chloroflexi bacterium RBG_16_50_9]|nr:MAG: hypothetical protein A2144_14915 [Chloroflexi bacterium RBG_16_50_9]